MPVAEVEADNVERVDYKLEQQVADRQAPEHCIDLCDREQVEAPAEEPVVDGIEADD